MSEQKVLEELDQTMLTDEWYQKFLEELKRGGIIILPFSLIRPLRKDEPLKEALVMGILLTKRLLRDAKQGLIL